MDFLSSSCVLFVDWHILQVEELEESLVSLLVVPKYILLFLWKHTSREDCWNSDCGMNQGLSGHALFCLSDSEFMLLFWGPKEYFWWKIQDLFCTLWFTTDLKHFCCMSDIGSILPLVLWYSWNTDPAAVFYYWVLSAEPVWAGTWDYQRWIYVCSFLWNQQTKMLPIF